ncbi:hypothetical protein NDU88_004517 [Pleurodeles waltl]|uniref:LIM zinc-binding domain-containing protein n=1 Tax=Pleurodeles waltl TaxID=8319 RepID=A0AAV7M7Q8_PLEWA|nr:hypothetical protein NDU88_004517 [Pleurodeles waltl]
MEETATRRRAQSLRNTNKDPSDDRQESKQHQGVIGRRKSVSELVARYQNVRDNHTGQKEEKVQTGSVQKKTATMDLLKKTSEDCHVENKDFTRSKSGERDKSQKNRTISSNRNLLMMSGTTQVNSRVQHKTGSAQTEKTQLFSGTKLSENQHKTSFAKRYEALDKDLIESTPSTKKIALKERHTLSTEEHRIKKENEHAGRKVSETRVQALPQTLSGSTNGKHYRKALPHLEQLQEARPVPLKRPTVAVPSVKERSALYLSKAAATPKVGPKQSQRTKKDTASANNNSQLKKHVSAAREICPACLKPVYSMERMVLDKVILHQTCFLCKQCNKKLSLHNFGVYRGNVYCKDHHSLLIKAKENNIESLNGKPQKEHQLNKPALSNLGTDIRGPLDQEKPKFHKMENVESKQNKALLGDIKVFRQNRKSGSAVSGYADPGKKLKIHWPPLQTPIKDIKSNNCRLLTIQCPPLNSGPILQTNKTPIKLALNTNKPPIWKSMTENSVERHTISVSNVPFSIEDSSIFAKNASGDGRRTLQQLTQKLKSHNGNTVRAKVGYNGKRLVENNAVFQNTNRILSPATQVSFNSLSSHLKILKVTKPTNPKPVMKIKSGLSVSSDGNHINTDNKDSLTPSSHNTLITLNQEVTHSSLLKMDTKPDPTAVLASPSLTLEKQKENKADTGSSKKGIVDVQEPSALVAFSGSDHLEEIDCVSQPCQPVACALTVQETCSKTNGKTFFSDILLVSDVSSEESARLNLSMVTKTIEIAIDDPKVINKENDILSNTNQLTQKETDVKAGDLFLYDEESIGTENNQLNQSYTFEIDKDYVEHIHQENSTEKNKVRHELEPNCLSTGRKEPYYQEMDCSDSGDKVNQETTQKHTKQLGLIGMTRGNKLQPSPANLTTGSSLRVTTSAIAQPGIPHNPGHTTLQTDESSKMLEVTNIQKHAPEKKTAESIHSLASINKKDMLVCESPSETERSDVTEENREWQASKEHLLKPTGFGKNPFSRLFPLDPKGSKLKKEIAGNKKVSIAKTQSALEKAFGLSADALKIEEQIFETKELPQKPSDGTRRFECRPSQHFTGLEDTQNSATTPKEKKCMGTKKERTQEESKKLDEGCEESQIVDPLCCVEHQTGHVISKGLQLFKCNRIFESKDSTKFAGPENSSDTENEYERRNPSEMIQCPNDLQTAGRDQTQSKSEQTKGPQNSLLELLDGDISSESIISHSGPGIIETVATSQRSQTMPQTENKRTGPFYNGHAQALVHTDTPFDHLSKNEHQEQRFFSDNINLLGDEMPILPCDFERNLSCDINDPVTCHKNFETPSNANMCLIQPRDQQYFDSELDERSESPLPVNDVPPLLSVSPSLVTASGTPCDTDFTGMARERNIIGMPHDPDTTGAPSDIEGTNNFLNTALMDQSNAQFQDPSDHNDPFE